jgi:hypothetical protein
MALRPATSRDVEIQTEATTQLPSATTITPTMSTQIEVDPEYDSEEALLPIVNSRAGIRNHQIQELFSRHSQFRPRARDLSPERPVKVRRVEKPIRIRLHWTCHQCDTKFGCEQTCVSCGHRKCRECPRQPPKQVRIILDNTRQKMEREERDRHYLSSSDEEVTPRPVSIASSPATMLTTALQFASEPLESDSSMDEGKENIPFEFSFYTRPRTTTCSPFRQSRSRFIPRQMCHECESPLEPDSTDCLNCNHVQCDQCPNPTTMSPAVNPAVHWIAARRSMANRSASADDVPIVKSSVRRVYRKPRQRVRYNCDRCGTTFAEGDRCRDCGHDRCEDCHREP